MVQAGVNEPYGIVKWAIAVCVALPRRAGRKREAWLCSPWNLQSIVFASFSIGLSICGS
jgi:hypothetical protein